MISRDEAVLKLLDSYKANYNISPVEDSADGLCAICEYYEHSEKYVLSKKAELWSADGEEFLYVYNVANLNEEKFNAIYDHALNDGQKRMHINKNHMYTYITVLILCDFCEKSTIKKIKKSHYYKSFRFSFYGWLEYRNVVFCFENAKYISNPAGKSSVKSLKNVLRI